MLKFVVGICDDNHVELIVKSTYEEYRDTAIFSLLPFSRLTDVKHIEESIKRCNLIFSLLSEQESNYLFKQYQNIRHQMMQNYRSDEIKDVCKNVGLKIVDIVDKLSLIKLCEHTKLSRVDPILSCETFSCIAKIMLPILSVVVEKFYDKDVHLINSTKIVRVLNPLIDAFFSKMQIQMRNKISDQLKQPEEIVGSIRKNGRINTVPRFIEALYCTMISEVMIQSTEHSEIGLYADFIIRIDDYKNLLLSGKPTF